MIAIHGPRDGRVLRAELWLCSPVWCALRMGYGPGLVGGAAAAGCLVETILTSAADLSRSPGATSFETSCRGVQQSTPLCSRWYPVAAAGMGASVSGRHERLAALLIPTRSGNTWVSPSKRRAHDYGALP